MAALVIDLVMHRGEGGSARRSAVIWSGVWIALGLAFGLFVWWDLGPDRAVDYYAAYLIEKSLSVDNLFVFLIIFSALKVPRARQRTVLWWGILGAVGFRALFIFIGAEAIDRWSWVSYVFAGVLLIAAIRTFLEDPAEEKESRIVGWLARHLPVHSGDYSGFVVRKGGRLMVTPLLIALVAIETTDIAFAIDSVPAAFSVTRDRFVLYSSNILAILGLRALYLVLVEYLPRLVYLHYGLAAVLALAAGKIVLENWVHIPAWAAITATVAVMIASIVASLRAGDVQESE